LTSKPPCKPAPIDNDPSTKFLKAALSYQFVPRALFLDFHAHRIIQWMHIPATESSLMRGLLKKDQVGVLVMKLGEKRIEQKTRA
jgi:hypothetical protein